MPNPTPSAAAAPTRAERLRVWLEMLAATMDPDFPSTVAAGTAPGIDDESAVYGSELGGKPAFVAEDDAAWKG